MDKNNKGCYLKTAEVFQETNEFQTYRYRLNIEVSKTWPFFQTHLKNSRELGLFYILSK